MKLFRLSAAAVVIAVTFLAASSVHAVVIIQASETGGNVVFTLSGWVNLRSVSANFATEPGSSDTIWPSAGGLLFGTTQNNNGNVYDVPNLIGPSNFGPGNAASVSVTNTGSIFNFFAPTPNGGMLLDASYTSGSSLSNTMTFPGTFASLGM